MGGERTRANASRACRVAAILLAMSRGDIARAAGPTYSKDIAPIVYRACSPCHRPGESGPFSLLTYDDARRHAMQIAAATQRRYMPPWLPDEGHGDFVGPRRLTDAEIKLFGDWAALGAPEGVAEEAPAPPSFTEGWQLGPPDLIVEAPVAYSLAASGQDVYWNFIIPTKEKTLHYVRALEIRPGNKRVVHHSNLYVDRAKSARRQEVGAGKGFPGMDPVIDRPVSEPDDGHFLFWKPGGGPDIEPDGFSWKLDPGADLVLNTHLLPSGKPESIKPVVGLYFTDKPPTTFPMLVQLEHDGALDIPAGAKDFLVSDDFKLPMDVDVLAVYPHAHLLGKLFEGYATLPDGSRKWLIRIPEWDPNWQTTFRYRTPVFLPKGSVVSMRYHYDNSASNARNPNQPPKRVQAGIHSTDEMSHLWLQVLPKPTPTGKLDRRVELQEAVAEHRLAKYPNDFAAHFQLGTLRLARMNAGGALDLLQTAARMKPNDPEVHNALGSAMIANGRNREGMDEFRQAVKLRPDYTNARYNLARALARSYQFADAAVAFAEVAKEAPTDPRVRDELGEVYLKQHKLADALAQFNRALALDPQDRVARDNRDAILKQAPELAGGKGSAR